PALDLSGVAPKPIVRPDRLDAAVEEGRRRGFGERGKQSEPSPRQSRAQPNSRRPKEPSPKRVIVTLAERPADGATGQIALSGDATMLYEFVRRAHFERKPRGELLADMLRLYEDRHGPLPEDF
ncbi:MAG: hypothetical protein Q8R98_24500, partial [Rubrivivax sp.]|nr:hypothetical protein [Rubrivivax sp.]